MKAYKGFDSEMKCRGFQYVEGETYEQKRAAKLCETGFHAVLMPLDVLRYYHPRNGALFHEVDIDEVDSKREEDSKVAGRVIKIGASLTLPALIQAQVDFVFANSKKVTGATSKAKNAQVGTGVANGAATASGDSGAATASGRYGAATASGEAGRARGVVGNALFLAERDVSLKIINVAAVIVDGKKIKADTYYTLRGGKVVEA